MLGIYTIADALRVIGGIAFAAWVYYRIVRPIRLHIKDCEKFRQLCEEEVSA